MKTTQESEHLSKNTIGVDRNCTETTVTNNVSNERLYTNRTLKADPELHRQSGNLFCHNSFVVSSCASVYFVHAAHMAYSNTRKD